MKKPLTYAAVDLSALERDDADDGPDGGDRFLIFTIGGEAFGIRLGDVWEIAPYTEPTPVPGYPEFARGVMPLHGRMLPVIDIAGRLGRGKTTCGTRGSVIFAGGSRAEVGFLAERAESIASLPASAVSPPPAVDKAEASPFVSGIGELDGRPVVLLCPSALLTVEEAARLRAGGGAPAEKKPTKDTPAEKSSPKGVPPAGKSSPKGRPGREKPPESQMKNPPEAARTGASGA